MNRFEGVQFWGRVGNIPPLEICGVVSTFVYGVAQSRTWLKWLSSSSSSSKSLGYPRWCTCVLSLYGRVWLFATPWTVASQDPLSMGFSRQGYWSGLPCPPPGHLPGPWVKLASVMLPALAGGFFTRIPGGWAVKNPPAKAEDGG